MSPLYSSLVSSGHLEYLLERELVCVNVNAAYLRVSCSDLDLTCYESFVRVPAVLNMYSQECKEKGFKTFCFSFCTGLSGTVRDD